MENIMSTSPITQKHYVAIFLVALVTIATQILIGRILSVMYYYHFAFAGITFAMFGLTAGALKVYRKSDYFSSKRTNQVLAEYSSRFALSLSLSVIFHAWLIGVALNNHIEIVAFFLFISSIVLLLRAFTESGVCIALLLTRFPAFTSRLYTFDLAGAALGCIVIILALFVLDPISTLLLMSTTLAILGFVFLSAEASSSIKKRVKATAVTLCIISLIQIATLIGGSPLITLSWAKLEVITGEPVYQKWNTYSLIAVKSYEDKKPFGWGFGTAQKEQIEQKYLDIDWDAGTILTKFDGDLGKIKYLKNDIINIAYHLRSMNDVAVIGIGGGRDILSALSFGVKHVQGIELNPATTHALTHEFSDFVGHLDKRPDVSIATAEARSYLVSNQKTYDFIQISLIDTWAATAAGGLSLSESKLYTTDAWRDFMDRLNERGILSVSRWYDPTLHPGEFQRMAAIAGKLFRTMYPNDNPRAHMLAAYVSRPGASNGIITLILSKSAFTAEEVENFVATCEKLNFQPLLTPQKADETIAKLASGNEDQAFLDTLPLDVSASTDDRPFFFFMTRLESFFSNSQTQVSQDSTSAKNNLNYKNNLGVYTLLFVFIVTLFASIAYILFPLIIVSKQQKINITSAFPYMMYFGCIGLGFMLIEIAQMQRLMIFLGHPVYGLSVVLFTLLLASGIGSYLQRSVTRAQKNLWLWPLVLCLVLSMIGILTPQITDHLKFYDTGVRILATGLITGVMGLFMGMMFPIGVALASVNHETFLPWYWGINGAASVFASVFAVLLSLYYGISFTFWAGVAFYAVCVLIILVLSNKLNTAK